MVRVRAHDAKDAQEARASEANTPLLVATAIIAALLHLMALVVLHSSAAPTDAPVESRLRVRLQTRIVPEPNPAAQAQDPPAVTAAETPPSTISAPEPAPESESAIIPPKRPPPESTLQQYLSGGALPEVNLEPSKIPEEPSTAVFSPVLREQLAQAQARSSRRSVALYNQSYALSGGAEFERQGNNCFIGRDILSPSGPVRVWYPTACPQPNAAIKAIERLSIERLSLERLSQE